MKYLKLFTEKSNNQPEEKQFKRYLIVNFSKTSRDNVNCYYILTITRKTNFQINYDGFYYYNELGYLQIKKNVDDQYNNFNKFLDIIHETNSKKEALDMLKMLEDSKKFNL